MIEIVTPFLFDYSISKTEAKNACLLWLDNEFPNDEFKHTTEPGRDFDSRIVGWILKIDTRFSYKDTQIDGIRRIDPIAHFKGMCR